MGHKKRKNRLFSFLAGRLTCQRHIFLLENTGKVNFYTVWEIQVVMVSDGIKWF